MRKNWFSLVLILIVIVMGFEIIYLMKQNRELRGVISRATEFAQTLTKSDMVPPFSVLDLDDGIVEIEYSDDQPFTLLMWFSSSCAACDENFGFWNDLYLEYNHEGVRMLGMSADNPDRLQALVEEYGLEFPIARLDDSSLIEAYNGYTLPQTMLISPPGSIREIWRGSLEKTRRESVINAVARIGNLTGKGGDHE